MGYNDLENGRHSITVRLSNDKGEIWKMDSNLVKVENGEGSIAYPSAIQTKDGLIHIPYFYHLSDI